MQSAPKVTALSVKLPIVSLQFIQRNSKALNCDASINYTRPNYPRPVPPKVRNKSPPTCIFSRVNVCFHAGLPRSLYIQYECVFPCCTPTELVYLLVLMLDPTELFIIVCECVFPCWTPTELVYPV